MAVGVVLLLVGLLAAPVGAQEDQYDDDQNISEDGSCPGAQEVETITGTGSKQTAPFTIEGDVFRITSEVEATADPEFLGFSIFVQDEDGGFVAFITQEQEGTETSFINEGPGEFFLDIGSANANYTVTIADCVGEDDQQEEQREVIEGSIPEKRLPITGGPTLLIPAGAMLLGAGLTISRMIRRRS